MYIDIEINRMTKLYEISFGLNGFEYDYNVVVRKISKLESAKGYRITHGLSDECCVIVELDDVNRKITFFYQNTKLYEEKLSDLQYEFVVGELLNIWVYMNLS